MTERGATERKRFSHPPASGVFSTGQPRWSDSTAGGNIKPMTILRASVRNGRVTVDEPTDLPEGTKVELLLVDADAEMDGREQAAFDASIERGLGEADRGEVLSVQAVLARLSRI